jgi:CRISPR/Cas system-associated protein endoribonuclease Cas2
MLLCLEPPRAALPKRFCEIFLRTGYFMLKFAIKVNFVKIVSSRANHATRTHRRQAGSPVLLVVYTLGLFDA